MIRLLVRHPALEVTAYAYEPLVDHITISTPVRHTSKYVVDPSKTLARHPLVGVIWNLSQENKNRKAFARLELLGSDAHRPLIPLVDSSGEVGRISCYVVRALSLKHEVQSAYLCVH